MFDIFPLGKPLPKSEGYGEDGIVVYFDTVAGVQYTVKIYYKNPEDKPLMNLWYVDGDGTKQNVQHQLGTVERDGYKLQKIEVKKIEK